MTKIEMLKKNAEQYGWYFANETIEAYAKRHTKDDIKAFCDRNAKAYNKKRP